MEAFIDKIIANFGKENLDAFLKKFKEIMATSPQSEETKNLDIEIKGCSDEPNGISFETLLIPKAQYSNFASNADYMKDGVSIITVCINAKGEQDVEKLRALFDQMKPVVVEQIPFLKMIDFFFRADGLKMFIDVVFKDQTTLQLIKDMNIDFSKFCDFKVSLKFSLVIGDLFTLSFRELIEKLLTFSFTVNAKNTNIKNVLKAVLEALKVVTFEDEKKLKKIKKAKAIIFLWLAYSQTKFLFQFSPKEIIEILTEDFLKNTLEIDEDPDEAIAGTRMMGEQFGKDMIQPMLESLGLLEGAKLINIDAITIATLLPKFQSGFAHNLKLPGITQIINEKFLA